MIPQKSIVKLISLAVILLVFSLFFVFATLVYAAARFSDPGLEAVVGTPWAYSETDADYNDAFRSTNFTTEGTYSYEFGAVAVTIGNGKLSEVSQTIDLTTNQLDIISFDFRGSSSIADMDHGHFKVGGVELYSQALPTGITSYLNNEFDITAYNGGTAEIRFGLEVHGTPGGGRTLTGYFDNIRTWGSYSATGRTTVQNTFTLTSETVYMYGEGFTAVSNYDIAYYDGADARLVTDANIPPTNGILDSPSIKPSNYSSAISGTWHSVIFEQGSTVPDTYNAGTIKNVTGYVLQDSFTVSAAAIPEFPTILSAVVVTGVCFGIFYWLRRRVAHA